MAVSAYAIPTLLEVKGFLKIGSSDTTLDTTLEGWIDKTSLSIEKFLENKVAVQSITGEILDGDGTSRLYTKYFPVTQLSTESAPTDAQKLASLQYRNDPDSSWTDIMDDIDHVFLDVDRDYIELYDATFPVGQRNIKVSYKAGYSVIPGDIWMVAVEMAAWWYRQSREGDWALGKSSSGDSGAGGSISTSYREMQAEWERRLKPYRRDVKRKGLVKVWR
jgi:hypothetical protein